MSTHNLDPRSVLWDLANELDRAAEELNFIINGIDAADDELLDTQFHPSTGASFLLMGLRDRMTDWAKAAMTAVVAKHGEGQV